MNKNISCNFKKKKKRGKVHLQKLQNINKKTISLISVLFEKVFGNYLYYFYRGKFPYSFNYCCYIFSHLTLTFLIIEKVVSKSSKPGKVLITSGGLDSFRFEQ